MSEESRYCGECGEYIDPSEGDTRYHDLCNACDEMEDPQGFAEFQNR